MVACVGLLDEEHSRKTIVEKDVALGNGVVRSELHRVPTATFHGLEQESAANQSRYLLQCIQRMPKVVEDAHEHDVVELLAIDDMIDVIDVALNELDVKVQHFAGKTRLGQVDRVVVYAQHARRAAALHLE